MNHPITADIAVAYDRVSRLVELVARCPALEQWYTPNRDYEKGKLDTSFIWLDTILQGDERVASARQIAAATGTKWFKSDGDWRTDFAGVVIFLTGVEPRPEAAKEEVVL